jgi:hypothetical protein
MKKTLTIGNLEIDIVGWVIKGLIAVIMFFLVHLYTQIEDMDKRMDRQGEKISKIEGKLGITR